ncbi:alpha/beta hydrolase [Gordonia humi]|uniref:Arylformamidase n=1 Tax=Gordonia humi TaxID=686429 RepID=A0A840F2U7_9ACTN|nr:alpha/beta hydrolase [Gordonia humi]MBB4136798.1 arylformamidase [Gordonia humi]
MTRPEIAPETSADYDARATVSAAEFDSIMAEYRRRSDAAVADLTGAAGLVYDTPSGQRLDIWGTGDEPRPVFFVVHGGYWRMLAREDTAFMADALAADGIATVAVDYGLAPSTSLPEIVRQVRTALAWVYRNGRDYGLDVDRIVVGGSSAGAHLAAMTMVPGWQDAAGVPESTARAGLLLSGLYDLRPLVHAPANAWLGLTPESADAVSPARCSPPAAPVVVAMAESEAGGFHQQSRDLHRQWSGAGTAEPLTVPDRNHFDVFLDLADPSSTLSDSLRRLIAGTADPLPNDSET